MPEEVPPPVGGTVSDHATTVEHPEVRVEKTDARFRPILFLLLGTMVFAALIYVVVWGFFDHWRQHEEAVKKSPFPLAPEPSTALPAGPRLEEVDRMAGIEKPNVYQREKSKEDVLNSLGRTKEDGFVRIPIDRAMDLLENKLPARAAAAERGGLRADGLIDGGGPNSGREFRGKQR